MLKDEAAFCSFSINHAVAIEIPPNEKLVIGVKFAIAMTALLSTLEITHMALLKTWSTEIFSTITGLTGTITGILITTKT